MDIVDLTDAHVRAAGLLLAQRHARERARFELLPTAYEDPATAKDLVRETLEFCDGVAALERDGTLVGFLTAVESVPDPASPMARYAPERSARHLVHGHAVAGRAEPGPLYAALFAVLAERALEEGISDHVVHVPLGDPAVEAAWVALGFGRLNAVAVRDLRVVGRPTPGGVEVRMATVADLDTVDRLVDLEPAHHARGPMFQPYRRAETVAAVRAQLADRLGREDFAFFLARREGRDVGVISIGPGLGSPLYVPDGAAYIASTAVVVQARGQGVGVALVAAALRWARDHGHRAASLHYATANATSAAFWTGLGFTPVMAHLWRRLDERILAGRQGRATS